MERGCFRRDDGFREELDMGVDGSSEKKKKLFGVNGYSQ